MTEQVLVFAGAALAAVYVLDRETDELRLTGATSGGGPGAGDELPPSYPLSGRSPVVDAFRTGRPRWLSSAPGAEAAPAAPLLGALPLRANDRWLGCLVVLGDAQELDAERRELLELYADQVAVWLVAGGAAGDAAPLGRAGGGAGAGAAWESVRVGSVVLDLDTGRVAMDDAMLDLVGIAPQDFDGTVETLLSLTVPEDLPALMAVIEPGRAVPGGRELEFRVCRPTGELRWLRLRHRVVVDAAGRPRRVLGVVAEASHLRPTTDEVAVVQRLSAILATAMTVRDVGLGVVEALREPLAPDRLALYESQAGRLVVAVLHPPQPAESAGAWRSASPEVIARSLPTLQAALDSGRVGLWATSTGLEPSLAQVGPGGLAVLPLPADGSVAGLCLLGWDAPHRFRPEERSLLTATAGLVGQALTRSRALDAEHQLVVTLQRSMLPRKLPVLPGGTAVARYLPATAGLEVGGDWYDVIPLSDRYVALVIGDVQGHSAEAATVMGQIRTAIRAYAVEGHPPDVVVSHANRLLVGMEVEAFATCCYVALDMEEGDAWFVRAGHLPPLLRAPDGGTREIAVEGGPPLGVLADAEFPMTMVGLVPGSVLALLTDGLVESRSLRLDEGMLRVGAVLSATDPSDAERAADELLGGAVRRDDDVALLLMRYDGTRIRPLRAGWAVWRLPDATMHARRFTARTLRSWHVTEETGTVLLIVSELVTNALVHTQGEVRLDLTLAGDRLRVAVSDSSPRTPTKPTAIDWEATGGRGLLLVEAVSASWGSVPLSGGKQVWGEIALPPREPPSGDGEVTAG